MTRILLILGFIACVGPASAQDNLRVSDPIPAEVETVYLKGLRFLVATQTDEGFWPGNDGNLPGVVALALLAILAHGEDPEFGPYRNEVGLAIDYLVKSQNPQSGYIGTTMYNHGFATLALAEVYGTVNDDRLGPGLRKAVDLILNAQARNPKGAWRYSPDSTDADTTVAGAQMVALFAARNAGLSVPDEAIKKGLAYYDSCFTPGGGYGYSSPGSPNVPRTAIALLVLTLADAQDARGFQESLRYLTADLDYRDPNYPFYYEYYMAQALFRVEPELWKEWDSRNVRYLTGIQADDGSWDSSQGKTFATAAALLSMALNYRFLPIYER